MAVLVTGGARSGKSRFAEAYAARLGKEGLYIATSQLLDEEMRLRAERHRQRRSGSGITWRTVEEPYELSGLLRGLSSDLPSDSPSSPLDNSTSDSLDSLPSGPLDGPPTGANGSGSVVLVDCLTLWLSNWMLRFEQEDDPESKVADKVEELAEALSRLPDHVIAVTNEVGGGIVPEYPLGRRFRDLAGLMNQRIASVCDQVFLVTAGIPIELKSLAFRFPDEDGWMR